MLSIFTDRVKLPLKSTKKIFFKSTTSNINFKCFLHFSWSQSFNHKTINHLQQTKQREANMQKMIFFSPCGTEKIISIFFHIKCLARQRHPQQYIIYFYNCSPFFCFGIVNPHFIINNIWYDKWHIYHSPVHVLPQFFFLSVNHISLGYAAFFIITLARWNLSFSLLIK